MLGSRHSSAVRVVKRKSLVSRDRALLLEQNKLKALLLSKKPLPNYKYKGYEFRLSLARRGAGGGKWRAISTYTLISAHGNVPLAGTTWRSTQGIHNEVNFALQSSSGKTKSTYPLFAYKGYQFSTRSRKAATADSKWFFSRKERELPALGVPAQHAFASKDAAKASVDTALNVPVPKATPQAATAPEVERAAPVAKLPKTKILFVAGALAVAGGAYMMMNK